MQLAFYEALVAIGIGLVGLIGSFHLANQLSTMGVEPIMGPAKWSGGISLLIFACGMIQLIGHFIKRKSTDANMASVPRFFSVRGMILIVILALWVAAVAVLGFNLGCFVFFPLLFYIAGFRPWFKSLLVGCVMGLFFYTLFVIGIKLTVPKGIIGL